MSDCKYKVGMTVILKKSRRSGVITNVTDKKITVIYNAGMYDAEYEKSYYIRIADRIFYIENSDNKDCINDIGFYESVDREASAVINPKKVIYKPNGDKYVKWFLFIFAIAILVVGTLCSYKNTGSFDLVQVVTGGFGNFVYFGTIGLFFIIVAIIILYAFGNTANLIFCAIVTFLPGNNKKRNAGILIALFCVILVLIFGEVKAFSVIVGLFVGLNITIILSGFVAKVIGEKAGILTSFVLLPLALFSAIMTAYNDGIWRAILMLFIR